MHEGRHSKHGVAETEAVYGGTALSGTSGKCLWASRTGVDEFWRGEVFEGELRRGENHYGEHPRMAEQLSR